MTQSQVAEGMLMKQEGQQKAVKKTYVTPRLFEYGSVAKLTQTGSRGGSDSAGMMV